MKFPRTTIRLLMVIVPVLTLLAWGSIEAFGLLRLRARHLARATEHHRIAQDDRAAIQRMLAGLANVASSEQPFHVKVIQFTEDQARHHEQLSLKYQLAAFQPWVNVTPDPEGPQFLQPLPFIEPAEDLSFDVPADNNATH